VISIILIDDNNLIAILIYISDLDEIIASKRCYTVNRAFINSLNPFDYY